MRVWNGNITLQDGGAVCGRSLPHRRLWYGTGPYGTLTCVTQRAWGREGGPLCERFAQARPQLGLHCLAQRRDTGQIQGKLS